jgi:predicted anti-sigma-YlaC factor YlaD
VRCDQARAAASADLDGELPAAEQPELDEHLRGCAACREWVDESVALTRRLRVRAAPQPGPDLTDRVLTSTTPAAAPWSAERVLLALVGVVMLLAAVPAVLDAQGLHLPRDAGITDVALAVGVLSAAGRPWRAAGMLPVVVVLAAGLTATATVDVLTGAVSPQDEAVHVLAPTAAVLLWRLRRQTPTAPTAGPARRLRALGEDERRSA